MNLVMALLAIILSLQVASLLFLLQFTRQIAVRQWNQDVTDAVKKTREKHYLIPSLGKLTVKKKMPPKVCDDQAAWLAERKREQS